MGICVYIFCCSDRMPSDDESDAMHCMKQKFSGACHFGSGTAINMDEYSRPLTTLPRVGAPCAGLHDSHNLNMDNMAKGRLQPSRYPNSMHTQQKTLQEFSPVCTDVSHGSNDSCDEKTSH